MCPGIELVEARHELYVDYHNRIVEGGRDLRSRRRRHVDRRDGLQPHRAGSSRWWPRSISPGASSRPSSEHVGSTLRCSVGLAPNRYLAKIASDMEKPDGLVALTPDILKAALQRTESCAICPASARAWRSACTQRGIRTMTQLLAL